MISSAGLIGCVVAGLIAGALWPDAPITVVIGVVGGSAFIGASLGALGR